MRPPEDAVETIERFIADHLETSGCDGVAVAVSGGLDSAVVLTLAVGSVGAERTRALLMPELLESGKEEGRHMKDASALCEALGVEYSIVPIGDIVAAAAKPCGTSDPATLANLKARIRMSILYAIANEERRIVLGTSNKTELLVGYFTKWGDGASDYLPIGDLYKSQVRTLAEEIGVPAHLIEKVPTAGLLPGQCDEDDLGMDYGSLDRVLRGIEMRLDDDSISDREDISVEEVARVRGMVHGSIHKRRMPLVLKLGPRTPGYDWRE